MTKTVPLGNVPDVPLVVTVSGVIWAPEAAATNALSVALTGSGAAAVTG
jgi:hypothetical protein